MSWNNSWQNQWVGGNQPPTSPGLMAPWTNSWGAAPTQQVVQKEVGPSLRSDSVTDGEGAGHTVPGNSATAMQTSQATKDRVAGSLTGSMRGNLVNTGLKAGLGLALRMPSKMVGPAALGSMAGPGAVTNVLGGALNAALGTTPQGFLAKAVANFGVPALAGMALGPVGGLMGGMFGGLVSDAVMDGLDMRSREDVRDDYEGQAGAVKGRMAYADRMGLEQAAAAIRDSIPNSMASIHAMDEAIAETRALERSCGINPSYGANPGTSRSSGSYGGWGSVGGPSGGARAVDRGYGPSTGGFAGLGIGNPTSYGGGRGDSGGRDRGGFGDNDGNSDTAGNAGYGR